MSLTNLSNLINQDQKKQEPKVTKRKCYQYPIVEEATSYWDKFLSGRQDSISLIPTPKCAVFTLFLISFYMGLFGLILFGVSVNVLEKKIPYGQACDGKMQCKIDFYIDTQMPTPTYVYYELSNFYSNEKRFVDSINSDQLQGYDIDQVKQCPNAYLQSDMIRQNLSASGHFLYEQYANPCGLAAKYLFNDTFYIYNSGSESKKMNNTRLILPMYSREFKRNQNYFKQWLDMENELVQNWFVPTFHSSRLILYGILTGNLNSGSYTLYVRNQYPISIFEGEKTLILQSASELGTKNLALGLILLGGSGMNALAAVFLFFSKNRKQKTQVQQEPI